MSSNPITRAIEAMLEERASVAARLALLDDVIEKTRAVLGVTVQTPAAKTPRPVSKMVERFRERAAPASASDVLPVEISQVLQQRGPLAPAILAAKAKTTYYYIRKFVKAGLLVSSGETTARLISLPGQALPAKEEP